MRSAASESKALSEIREDFQEAKQRRDSRAVNPVKGSTARPGRSPTSIPRSQLGGGVDAQIREEDQSSEETLDRNHAYVTRPVRSGSMQDARGRNIRISDRLRRF